MPMTQADSSEPTPVEFIAKIIDEGDAQIVVFPKGVTLPFKRVSFRKDGDRVILEKASPPVVVWLSRLRWLNRR